MNCECGCGQLTSQTSNYRPRFIQGHNTRLRTSEQHWNWKGGRQINSSGGYIMIHRPNHHFADSRGYVREHRLVYEEYYKCCLLRTTVIHHKNHNVQDNRIENLQPEVNNSVHKIKHHYGIETGSRLCNNCNGKTVIGYQKGIHPHYYWYKDMFDKTKWLCNKCHCKQRRGTL